MKNGLIIDTAGTKRWYKNNQLHRLNAPAIEFASGTKCWYQNDKRHRLDGPAIEYADGSKYWYYQDKEILCSSQPEFEKLIKLKAFW